MRTMLHVARAESNVILNDKTRTMMQGLQLECCLWCWEYVLGATRLAFPDTPMFAQKIFMC